MNWRRGYRIFFGLARRTKNYFAWPMKANWTPTKSLPSKLPVCSVIDLGM